MAMQVKLAAVATWACWALLLLGQAPLLDASGPAGARAGLVYCEAAAEAEAAAAAACAEATSAAAAAGQPDQPGQQQQQQQQQECEGLPAAVFDKAVEPFVSLMMGAAAAAAAETGGGKARKPACSAAGKPATLRDSSCLAALPVVQLVLQQLLAHAASRESCSGSGASGDAPECSPAVLVCRLVQRTVCGSPPAMALLSAAAAGAQLQQQQCTTPPPAAAGAAAGDGGGGQAAVAALPGDGGFETPLLLAATTPLPGQTPAMSSRPAAADTPAAATGSAATGAPVSQWLLDTAAGWLQLLTACFQQLLAAQQTETATTALQLLGTHWLPAWQTLLQLLGAAMRLQLAAADAAVGCARAAAGQHNSSSHSSSKQVSPRDRQQQQQRLEAVAAAAVQVLCCGRTQLEQCLASSSSSEARLGAVVLMQQAAEALLSGLPGHLLAARLPLQPSGAAAPLQAGLAAAALAAVRPLQAEQATSGQLALQLAGQLSAQQQQQRGQALWHATLELLLQLLPALPAPGASGAALSAATLRVDDGLLACMARACDAGECSSVHGLAAWRCLHAQKRHAHASSLLSPCCCCSCSHCCCRSARSTACRSHAAAAGRPVGRLGGGRAAGQAGRQLA